MKSQPRTDAAQSLTTILAVVACFGAGSLYGWSGYMPAVRSAFALSYGAASMVFSAAIVSFTLGVLVASRIRLRMPALTAGATLCLVAASASPSFAAFLLCYGAGFGALAGVIYNRALAIAASRPRSHVMMPMIVAGFGFGGAVFGPLAAQLGASGWGLWSLAPAISVLGIAAVIWMIFDESGQSGSEVLVQHPSAEATAPAAAPKFRLLLVDAGITLLWIIFASGSLAGLVVIGLSAQVLEQVGASSLLVAVGLFTVAAANTLGRLAAAPIAGIWGPGSAIVAALVASIAALLAIWGGSSPVGALVGLVVVAFAYGHLASNMPMLVQKGTDSDGFAKSFGWVFTGWGVAGLFGPWGAGLLRDVTGSFDAVLLICAVASAAGLTAALFSSRW